MHIDPTISSIALNRDGDSYLPNAFAFSVKCGSTSKTSLLGYYALCSFTVVNTIVCWIVAGVCYLIGKKEAANEAPYLTVQRLDCGFRFGVEALFIVALLG